MNIMALLRAKSTVAYLTDSASIRQGLEKFLAEGFTAIPVIREDGSYVGTITEGDFLRYIVFTESEIDAQENHKISELIRVGFNPAARIDITPEGLLEHIQSQNFVPMVDDRNLFIGIITRQDVIRAIRKEIGGRAE